MRFDQYQQIYEAKHDDDLLQLAERSAELTDDARAALQSELSRRGLKAGSVSVADTGADPPGQSTAYILLSSQRFKTVAEFLTAVMSTYRVHFWFFIAMVAPAIVFGFYGRELSRMFARHLVQEFLSHAEGLTQSKVRLEAATVGGVINFLIWTCFCLCYAGTASAVRQIKQGDAPLFGSSLDGVFAHPGRFLGISTVLCLSFAALTGCGAFVYLWILSFPVELRWPTDQIVLYALYFMVTLVLSRFALAIPSVTLGNSTVRQSIFLSDEMTKGKWGQLGALLLKSLVGGYIAAMLPFWIAGWLSISVNGWILSALSIAGVILVEPILFIGFSLLYVNGMDAAQPSDTAIAVQV